MNSDQTVGLVVIFAALFVGGFLLSFILAYMRSHRLVVRSYESKRVLGYYWVVPKLDKKTATIWWKSVWFQRPIKIHEPPDEVVSTNPRGKNFVEVYRISEDEFVFINDKGLEFREIVDKKTGKINKVLIDVLDKGGYKVIDSFKPFSIVQRNIIVQQFAKAEAMKKGSWLKENGMNIAAMSMMMIIIVVGLIYWGDIAKFTLEKDAASSGSLKEVQKLLQEFKGDATIVAADTGGLVVQGSEEPPIIQNG